MSTRNTRKIKDILKKGISPDKPHPSKRWPISYERVTKWMKRFQVRAELPL